MSAATLERRKHKKLREKLWRRLRDHIQRAEYRAANNENAFVDTKRRLNEATFLLDALRETGAK